MNEFLKIYLSDHVALMTGEIELITRCQQSNAESNRDLFRFLGLLSEEVKIQKQTLLDLLSDLGGSRPISKEWAGWALEKVGRLKMNGEFLKYSPLSRVVELEAMMAASQSRLLLWKTLVDLDIRGETRRLSESFVDRAKDHIERLRMFYRDATQVAFGEEKFPEKYKIPVNQC